MALGLRFLPRLLLHLLVLRPLLHLLFGLNVRGRGNLPRRGPFVLAANHNSHLDILMLFAALPLRFLCRTHAVAARDYFARRPRLFAAVDYLFQPIWVVRGGAAGNVLPTMLEKLELGENIIIFPEGTRGEAGKIGRFHGGVGRVLARRPDVPLLPAFLLGTEKAMPRKAALPLPVWHQVTIGPPQEVSTDASETTQALRESILALGRSETASRHRRRSERHEAFVVAVLGIDGSGKSTLSRRLAVEIAARESTCLIGDGLELFAAGRARAAQPLVKERLRAWLEARTKHAKSLARYKIPKLTELFLRDALLAEAKRWYGPDVVVMDGSPLLNMTAWSVLYRKEALSESFCAQVIGILAGRTPSLASHKELYEEFPVLRMMKRLGLTRLALPDAILFLDVEPRVAMQRIRERGKSLQVHETEEKLARLREAYAVVVAAVQKEFTRPAFVFSGEQDADYVSAAALGLLAEARGAREGREPATEPTVEQGLTMDEGIVVIATTISGSIRDWGKVERITPLFAGHGMHELRLQSVDSHAAAREAAREAIAAGTRTLISAGGSGTFNAVLEGCCASGVALEEIRLGFLRKGSADLIGKVLGMPDEIEEAISVFAESIRNDETLPCDLLEAGCPSLDRLPRHFVGYGGAGIFGRIPHFTENRFMKWYKGVLSQFFGDLGPFTTGMALAVSEYLVRRPFTRRRRWRVKVDGETAAEEVYHSLVVVNGYLGPNLPWASDPLGSGHFHLFALRDLGLARFPGQLRSARSARITEDPQRWGMDSFTPESTLELEPADGGAFPLNVDGSTLHCLESARIQRRGRIHLIARRPAQEARPRTSL